MERRQINILTDMRVLLFMFLFMNSRCHGQTDSVRFINLEDTLFDVMPYELKGNNFPKRINCTGMVVDYTSGFSCGVMNSSGTIKVLLNQDKTNSYKEDYAYFVVPCLSSNMYLNKTIKISGRIINTQKSLKGNGTIFNKFRDYSVPFYAQRGTIVIVPAP